MDVDTQKPCQYDLQALAEAYLLQLVPEASVVASAADLAEGRAEVGSGEVSEEETDQTFEADAEALDTKVEAVLVGEVGMAVAPLMATVMVQHHPLTLLLALGGEEASVVGTVVPL